MTKCKSVIANGAPGTGQGLQHDFQRYLIMQSKKFDKSIRFSHLNNKKPITTVSSIDDEGATLFAVGVGSVQPNEDHVLFLDLDNYDKNECESIARELIANLGVSDCYIVQSSSISKRGTNHHLVCFDMVSFEKARKVAQAYGHEAWAKFRGMNEDYVLRIGPKFLFENGKLLPVSGTVPKLVSVVKSPFSYRKKCNALRRIFRNVWNYPIDKDDMFDESLKFRFHLYRIRLVKGKHGKIVSTVKGERK